MTNIEKLGFGNIMNSDGDVVVDPSLIEDGSIHKETGFDHSYSNASVDILFQAPPDVQPVAEAVGTIEDVNKLPVKDRKERLLQLKDTEDFYPQGNLEFNRMMLMSEGGPNRTLKYLDEVYVHRVNETRRKQEAGKLGKDISPRDEATKTLRSIVHEFDGYASDARALRSFVRELDRRIVDSGATNFTLFENIPQLKDWQDEDGTRRTLTAVAKYIETQDFVDENGPDLLGKKVIIDNDKDKVQRIKDLIGGLRTSEMRNYIKSVREEQDARFNYWTKRIEEATKHLYVRGQGFRALRSLEVTDEF